MALWKATVSGSPCVRRRSSTGVRSPPPPNHHLAVTTMRVFVCAVGTFGLTGWAMSETPDGVYLATLPRGLPGRPVNVADDSVRVFSRHDGAIRVRKMQLESAETIGGLYDDRGEYAGG